MMTAAPAHQNAAPSTNGAAATEGADMDLPVIELARPMPGFPEHRHFTLVALDDASLLCSLQSLEEEALRFLVVPPHPFFPEYAPVIDDETVGELGVQSAEDVMLLLVVTAGESLAETTVNLAAPIVVNSSTMQAAQVILEDPAWPVKAGLATP